MTDTPADINYIKTIQPILKETDAIEKGSASLAEQLVKAIAESESSSPASTSTSTSTSTSPASTSTSTS